MKKENEKVKKSNRFRTMIQLMALVIINGYAAGFAGGKIFKGGSKAFCVPVLNCYSCPGALGACPIGSLQAVIGSRKYHVSFYVLGTLMLFGVLLGRVVCGFLCPFGLVQDLLHKIPLPKVKVPKNIDKVLRYLKYIVLVTLVLTLPMLLTDEYGTGEPFFCKLICPAGTLGGAFPLLAMNKSMRQALGMLFNWKVCVLVIILILSTMIFRPFCRYLCPLGAFYGLFNKFSLYQINIDQDKCVDCHACEKACPMEVEVLKHCNGTECIRCGKCKAVCPTGAISAGYKQAFHRET